MPRSLVNYGNNQQLFVDNIQGYTILGSPVSNDFLIFNGSNFVYLQYSGGGPGSITVNSVGTGASILKSFLANNLLLKSILGDSNTINVSSLTDEVQIGLPTNIKFINDQDITITDEGASVLKTLYFKAKYGILDSIPMSINNQGRIDIFGPLYLNSIADGVVDNQKFLGLDINNKVVRSAITYPFALTNCANRPATPLGSGLDVFQSLSGSVAQFRCLKTGNGLAGVQNADEITLSIDTTMDNIDSINAGTPIVNFAIFSNNIGFPTIPNLVPSVLRKGLYIDTVTKNIFYADVVKTVTHSGTGTTLINPTSFGETPQLKGLVAGTNVTLSTTNSAITINATSTASPSIYTADGTLNNTQRIVTGLNPGDIANNVLWSDIIPGYNSSWMIPTNVPIANNSYSGIVNPELMMSATSNGSQGKFMWAPYNYLSQKIEFKLGGGFGDQKTIFACFSNISGTKDFIFNIDLYEAESVLDAFSAQWEFCMNSRQVIQPGWLHVKPKNTTVINYSGSENLIGLQIRDTTGIGGSGWEISFIQEGLSTGAYTSRYIAFIRCQHQGDGSMEIYDNAFSGIPSNNYQQDLYLLWENGISFPIATQFSYKNFGKDIKFTFNSNIQQVSGTGGLAIFEVLFNGQNVIQHNMSTNSVTNVNAAVTFTRIMKYVDLVQAGALNLGGSTAVTFNQIGGFVSMTNFPYEILIEYY